jgi:hypothetical protein
MTTKDRDQKDIFELLGVFTKPANIDCENCDNVLEHTARQHLANLDAYKRIRDGCDAEIAAIEDKRTSANTLINMTETLAKLMKIGSVPTTSTVPAASAVPVASTVPEVKQKPEQLSINTKRQRAPMVSSQTHQAIVRVFQRVDPANPFGVRLSQKEIVYMMNRCKSYVSVYRHSCKNHGVTPVLELDPKYINDVYKLNASAEKYL